MIPGLTSIVVPAYNHAQWLPEAIKSALAQTARVEVIVVDDGSTDDTLPWLERQDDPRLVMLRQPHRGPSATRNAGIAAARGEFIMFLDADDTIEPTKVEEQIAAFSDDVGWILCDVRIEDAGRRVVENASTRYRYAERGLGGWVRSQLAISNFIPVMAPLVRRSVLGNDVRFSDQLHPEDWHFWYAVAAHARLRYLPRVLATYRKRRIGRSREGLPSIAPNAVAGDPVLLNLGCGTPGSPSWHPMPSCVNLDRSMGWMFEDGLPQYPDASVDGITISHTLMYVHAEDWPRVFAEFARVLKPGAIVRITEDDAENPASSRHGGWRGSEPAITITSAAVVRRALEQAGLTAFDVTRDASHFAGGTLNQAQHGNPPDVFFVEGLKS